MAARGLPKWIKQELRRLTDLAHERELEAAAAALEARFAEWRRGELDVFELNEHIHRFHQGPSRELFNRYDSSAAELVVPLAIARGIISESEVDPLVLEDRRAAIEVCRPR